MTIDDFYDIYYDTGDISWYFYSYDLFTNEGNDILTEKEKLGYIFPNNTKFDNLREYIAEIRLVKNFLSPKNQDLLYRCCMVHRLRMRVRAISYKVDVRV